MATEIDQENVSESTAGDRLKGWAKVAVLIMMLFLVFGDVALYSLYQAQRSRVETLNHRVERLDNMLVDLLGAQGNAEKIELIEQQVDALGNRVGDLKKVLEAESNTPPPKKRRR